MRKKMWCSFLAVAAVCAVFVCPAPADTGATGNSNDQVPPVLQSNGAKPVNQNIRLNTPGHYTTEQARELNRQYMKANAPVNDQAVVAPVVTGDGKVVYPGGGKAMKKGDDPITDRQPAVPDPALLQAGELINQSLIGRYRGLDAQKLANLLQEKNGNGTNKIPPSVAIKVLTLLTQATAGELVRKDNDNRTRNAQAVIDRLTDRDLLSAMSTLLQNNNDAVSKKLAELIGVRLNALAEEGGEPALP